MALTVGTLLAKFDGDASGYLRTAKKVRADAKKTERDMQVTGKIDADTAPLKKRLAEARAAVAAATRQEALLRVDADIKKAQARIAELEKKRGKTKVDVDAEISKAQAKIKTLEARRNAVRLAVEVDAEQARLAGEQANEETAEGLKKSTAVQRASESVARRANARFSAIVAAGAFAGLPSAAAVASTGVVAALGAVPAAFITIGAVASATRDEVASEWKALGTELVLTARSAAEPMTDEFVDAAQTLRATVRDTSDEVHTAFAYAAEGIDPLIEGVDTATRVAMPGLVVAAQRSEGVMRGVGGLATQMGHGVREMLFTLSTGSDEAGESLEVTGRILRDFLGFVGQLTVNLSESTPIMGQFRGVLGQVEEIILKLTSGEFPALTGATSGFLTVVSGGLSLVERLMTLLGGLAGPAAAAVGGFKALDMITFGRLTGRLRGVRTEMSHVQGASNKLKAGLSAVATGGTLPMLAATAGLGAALAVLAEKEQIAAQRAAEVQEAQDGYTEALQRNGNVIDDQIRALAEQGLAADDARAAAAILGIEWDTLTDAATGNHDAIAEVTARLTEWKTAMGHGPGQISALTAAVDDSLGPAYLLEQAFGKQTEALQRAREEQERAREAALNAADGANTLTDAQEGTATSVRNLEAAFGVLADTEEDVESKGQSIIAMLAELEGRTPSAEEAVQSLNDSIREMGDELDDGIDKADGWGKELVKASGEIDTVTANGSKLQDFLTGAAEDMGTMAKAWAESGVPAAEVNRKLAEQRDRLAETLEAWGLNEDQIDDVLRYYGLVPEKISTSAELTGDALEQTKLILTELEKLPPGKSVHLDAMTSDAQAALTELGYTIVELPDGSFEVFADTAAGRQAAQAFADEVNGTVVTATMGADSSPARGALGKWFTDVSRTLGVATMDADGRPADDQRRAWLRLAGRTLGIASMGANTRGAVSSLRSWVSSANRSTGRPDLKLNDSPARSSLWDFERRASQDVYKRVIVETLTRNQWWNAAGNVWEGGVPVGFADGGTLSDGPRNYGRLDANQAAIAPPNRLMAVVPFIGDRKHNREFYIPDNGSARSRALLQVANESILGAPHPLGMQDGGTLAPAPSMAATTTATAGRATGTVTAPTTDPAVVRELRQTRAAIDRQTSTLARAIATGSTIVVDSRVIAQATQRGARLNAQR